MGCGFWPIIRVHHHFGQGLSLFLFAKFYLFPLNKLPLILLIIENFTLVKKMHISLLGEGVGVCVCVCVWGGGGGVTRG